MDKRRQILTAEDIPHVFLLLRPAGNDWIDIAHALLSNSECDIQDIRYKWNQLSMDYSVGLLMTIQMWITQTKQSTVGDLYDAVYTVHPSYASKLLKYVSEREGSSQTTKIRNEAKVTELRLKLSKVIANWYIIASLLGMDYLDSMIVAHNRRSASERFDNCIDLLYQKRKLTQEGIDFVIKFLDL